jgi:GNAT superfamily N-acetyltransferase
MPPVQLPEGFTRRPATAADVDAIFELIAACELEDDGVVEVDRYDVAVGFERHGLEPDLDTLLVFEGEGLAAWAELYRGRAEADVRPTHRGRGIGTTLLSWIEARAGALGEPRVGQTKTDANTGARELLITSGYEPSWTSWIIRMELARPPEPPVVPAGISIRPYERSDARLVHEVIDDAFSEWPGRDPEPYEVWAAQAITHPAFEPSLSPLAFDGEELVGAVLSMDYPEEGWIQQVATKSRHRRRGIAQALLLTAFGGFYRRGRPMAGVSTDSRTGALGLYEKVGMRVVRRYTRYTKHLTR